VAIVTRETTTCPWWAKERALVSLQALEEGFEWRGHSRHDLIAAIEKGEKLGREFLMDYISSSAEHN